MSETNRRKFLGVAGASTAAGAVGMVGLGASPASAARLHPRSPKAAVVAWVSDHASDKVTLMVGEREVVVRDRDLATRILNAAKEA